MPALWFWDEIAQARIENFFAALFGELRIESPCDDREEADLRGGNDGTGADTIDQPALQ